MGNLEGCCANSSLQQCTADGMLMLSGASSLSCLTLQHHKFSGELPLSVSLCCCKVEAAEWGAATEHEHAISSCSRKEVFAQCAA